MVNALNPSAAQFKEKLRSRAPVVGTFVKTDSYQTVELLALSGLDFLVLDCEHAPWGRARIDAALMAGRAAGIAMIVRVPNAAPDTLLSVLDMGAAGVLVPHVCDAAKARAVASATHYLNGSRGLSGSVRAAGYGAGSLRAYVEQADTEVSVLCQIEDLAGVDAVEEILAVSGVDAAFIGPADLSAAYGVFDPSDAKVTSAINRIIASGEGSRKSVGIYMNDAAHVGRMRKQGVSLFVLASDQRLLRQGAARLARDFQSALG